MKNTGAQKPMIVTINSSSDKTDMLRIVRKMEKAVAEDRQVIAWIDSAGSTASMGRMK